MQTLVREFLNQKQNLVLSFRNICQAQFKQGKYFETRFEIVTCRFEYIQIFSNFPEKSYEDLNSVVPVVTFKQK